MNRDVFKVFSSWIPARGRPAKRRPWLPEVEMLETREVPSVATINWNDVYQQIAGFGASSAWTLPSMTAAQADLLFSQTKGIGLSLLRSQISDASTSGTSAEIASMQMAQARGATVWSTPWSPPALWKANRSVDNGGSLLPSHYQDYANMLANYVLNMKAQGVNIHAVSIQNEPDYTASYDSATWTAQQFHDFVAVLGPTFAKDGITAKIMLPEESGWHFELASTTLADPSTAKYIGIVAGHDYDGGISPVPQASGYQLWETEVSDFSAFDASMTSGLKYATQIHNFMTVAQANAWNFWWLKAGGADNEGLLGSSGQVTKRLYTLGNYSKFIRPGFERIGESDDGGVLISAYKDLGTGKFAFVAVNAGPATTETFHLNGFTASSVTPWVTSAALNLAQEGDVSVPGGSFTYTLAAGSVTTFVGTATPIPLQVVPGSFAATASGFSLRFNAPFLVNSLTPVLYGTGYLATAPVPSVTLTQTLDSAGQPVNNPIAGSLVLNTATNSITLVATDTTLQVNNGWPVLPDGSYTVVVHGRAAGNGFQALNAGGGFLDGLGTGMPGSGDYTQTFVVNAMAAHDDVVWVPATADGPGQALNAPGMNQAGGGYPVYLSDSTGVVTSVQLILNYDPALLTVTGASGAGFALLGSSTPGHAVLQYLGSPLPSGSQTPLGFITAMVPAGTVSNPTPYKAKDLLHLSNVALNGGAIPVATSDALHLVAYVGDGDGNGSYSSNDAVLITRVALQTDSGFTTYPLVDPVIVADTDGTGFIPADAGLQANEAGVGLPTANLSIPPIPSGVVFQSIANNVDPSVSIPTSLHAGADGTLTEPVNIDDAHPAGSSGLVRAYLALIYDPRLFTISAADVHLGSVLVAGSGWTVDPTINPATGEIAIALSSTTPITSTTGGSLVTIDFHLANGEPGGVSPRSPAAIALVASVSPNGQFFMTSLQDAQGAFTLSPAPTNNLLGRIEATVALTAASSAASGSRPLAAAGTFHATVPVEIETNENHAIDLTAPETVPVSPAVILEAGEQGNAGPVPEAGHISLHGAA